MQYGEGRWTLFGIGASRHDTDSLAAYLSIRADVHAAARWVGSAVTAAAAVMN